MVTSYAVDSLHINVGAGDSAIHLLVENPDADKPKVMRACLIDGGKPNKDPPQKIRDTIERIENEYDLFNHKSDKGYMRFDSVVITHWDDDHFGGIDQLIQGDFQSQFESLKEKENRNNEDKDILNLLKQCQCRYFLYDSNSRDENKYCLTTLYAPYWDENAENFDTDGKRKESDPKKSKPNDKMDNPKNFIGSDSRFSFWFVLRRGHGPLTNKEWKKANVKISNLCNLRYEPNQIIGTNLFDNSHLESKRYQEIDSKEMLARVMEGTKIGDGQVPVGIYCVSSRNCVIGPEPEKKSIGFSSEAEPDIGSFLLDDNVNKKNYCSIGAIVLWTRPEPTATHYFAGDLGYKAEERIANWIGGPVTNMKLRQASLIKQPHALTLTKRSHHGDVKCTPIRMLDMLSPENIIISAGAMHCHPSWGTLLYLNAWLMKNNNKEPKPVYATRLVAHYKKYTESSHSVLQKAWRFNLSRMFRNPSGISAQQPLDLVLYIKIRSKKDGTTGPHNLVTVVNVNEIEQPEDSSYSKPRKADRTANSSNNGNHPMLNVDITDDLLTENEEDISEEDIPEEDIHEKDISEEDFPEEDIHEEDIPEEDILSNQAQVQYPGFYSPVKAYQKYNLLCSINPFDKPGPCIDDGYWLGSIPGDGVTIISDKGLKEFVDRLPYKRFGLIKKPEANSRTPFLQNEEWNCWFADVFSSTVHLDIVAESEGKPSAFLFATRSPGGSTLTFDTRAVCKAFNICQGTVPNMGIIDQANTMVFGFDPDGEDDFDKRSTFEEQAITAKLSDILKYVDLERIAENPLINKLGTEKTLSLSTKDGSRNAVWFEPASAYQVTQRLQWCVDSSPLHQLMQDCGIKLELEDVMIVTTRTTSWRPGPEMVSKGMLILQATVKVPSSELALICSISLSNDGLTLLVSATKSSWNAFVAWLGRVLESIDLSPVSRALEGLDFIGDVFTPRRLSLSVRQADGKTSLQGWMVDVEISIKSVPILISYSSSTGRLIGQLWLASTQTSKELLPGWEPSEFLDPLTENPESELKLSELGIDEKSIPGGIPNTIRQARIEIDTQTKAIRMSAIIFCEPPAPGQAVPPISLDVVELEASYSRTDKLSVLLFLAASLNNRQTPESDNDDEEPDDESYEATLDGTIEYNGSNKTWSLSGSVTALNFGSLYQLLDPSAQDDVAAVLGYLEIANLDLNYSYEGGKGSKFELSGTLYLGNVALSMKYTYDTTGWYLSADLDATELSDPLTLGDILDSLTDNHGDDAEALPDFILSLPIKKGPSDKIISLSCVKLSKGTGQVAATQADRKESYILFQATVSIGPINVNFSHYRDLALNPKSPPKRVFSVSMGGLPKLTVDTLGDLPQPFDEIAYLWVQDKGQKGNNTGLTQEDIERINNGRPNQPSEDWLFYRDTRKPEQRNPTDTKQAILDYTMGREKKGSVPACGQAVAATGGSSKGNSAMAAYKKVAGAISISGVGIKYENKSLSVLLDASFVLGPIGFTFIGAAIKIDLSKNTLRDITLDNVSFGLSGLAVAFNQSPVRIGGIFVQRTQGNIQYYAGGIVIGLEPYQFVAAGIYGKVNEQVKYDTAFVFAKLEGPLITLEFAEISGITGGFGYNSEIKLPTVETVREFPFLQGTDISDDLLEYLGKLVVDGSGAFAIRKGAMWFAAGLKISALQMLDIDAVFVVSWDPSITLGIFGVAVANIPKTKGSKTTFAHVELGILAEIDFGAGVFKVEMQLAPSSYIFDPNCRLTGGFAFLYWFNDNVPERRGEWVLTIGGYHRSFQRPVYYPTPPRLGIQWQVGSNISIVGEAYFAVTPKCCMGGGRLQASLTVGPLRAWFSAWADFLINYMPFDFIGQVGVSVGVSCKVDLLITSFTVSVEVGAQLDLMGPPLHGQVKVDFWVVSFSVNFGEPAERDSPPSLDQFYDMVVVSGHESIVTSLAVAAAPSLQEKNEDNPHVFTCRGGMVQDENKGDQVISREKTAWAVKADEFVFAIDVRFPLTHAKVKRPKEFGENSEVPEWESKEQEALYGKPMETKSAIVSSLTVDIIPMESESVLMEDDKLTSENWRVTEIVKDVPSALWGEYNASENPRKTGKNDIQSLLDGKKGTLSKLVGLSIQPPKPKLADDKIGTFVAAKAMEMAVFTENETPKFVGIKDADANFYPSDEPDRSDKVKKIWRETLCSARKDILNGLAGGLGWKTSLTAATPQRLVAEFGSFYMEDPQISCR
ncbi:hypothetical protein EYZ11_010520 [Aspergillus tanneri]|uniref:DUF6603 domain-containing protein n=1 Tax=Aspergillus tanneri TaxID=1220188 RepID=A0A4S3J7A2_9EURO|nr:hypothetical protein EYZ11_010520 [Aspergillus tanneri]